MRPEGGHVVPGSRLVIGAFNLRRVNCFGYVFSLLCYGALALNPCLGADVSNTRLHPSQPQIVLEQSILTRAIGIEAPSKLVGLLDTMPLGVVPRDTMSAKARAALWSLFFRGSMTKLARVPSPQPFIAFYNPIADVAVIEGCRVDPVTRVMLCAQACAIPGEIFEGESAELQPRWMGSSDPMSTMQRIAGARMHAFAAANPASSPETSFWRRSYCSAENQNTAEKRLIALANSTGRIDVKHFREAAYHYLAYAIRKAAAQQRASTKPAPDGMVMILTHLKEMTMSGAIQPRAGGLAIFLAEKRSGWHIAVLTASANPNGTMTLENARFLAISSKGI